MFFQTTQQGDITFSLAYDSQVNDYNAMLYVSTANSLRLREKMKSRKPALLGGGFMTSKLE